jgi:CRISPR system Cascade subunit CasA
MIQIEERAKEFCLLDSDWIKVLNSDGQTEEVSLLDVFRRAHEFKDLAGELPTQDVAILRLLLAILYAVFAPADRDGKPLGLANSQDALQCWRSIWEQDSFPYEVIESYLRHYQERFYLFHPETPFYQVAGVAQYYDAVKDTTLVMLVPDRGSNNKQNLFAAQAGEALSSLEYAQATRWLVYCQAFNDGALKDRLKDETGNAKVGGASWCSKLGIVYAHGRTLFETLMLNFILLEGEMASVMLIGSPAWEKDDNESCTKRLGVRTEDYVELLTAQTRRILLHRDSGRVTGCTCLVGDVYEKTNAFAEKMTAWRRNKQDKQAEAFFPKQHNAQRSMWRDFGALLASVDSRGSQPAGVVSWLNELKRNGVDLGSLVTFAICGNMFGDAQQANITEMVADSLSIHAGLLIDLADSNPTWVDRKSVV